MIAEAPVIVAPGVKLPAGTYAGIKKVSAIGALSGSQWTTPTYWLHMTAEELVRVGASFPNNLTSTDFLVTEMVHQGELHVR